VSPDTRPLLLMGLLMGTKTKRPGGRLKSSCLAERAGFEPAEGY
jgi:hypothetical protein